MTPPDPPTLLCIVGDSRCGSTLLQYLLASQPGVVALGEVRRLEIFLAENRHCTCGAPVGECRWWRHLRRSAGLQDRGPATSPPAGRVSRWLGEILLLLSWRVGRLEVARRWLPRRAAIARDVADLALAAAGNAQVVVDSSKDPGHYLTLMLQDRIAVRPVVLLRDGRAVVWSQIRRTGLPVGRAIRHWRRVMLAIEQVQQGAAEPPLMLRYEDLCREPRAALSRVLAAAGMSLGEPATPDLHAIGGSPDFQPSQLDELRVDERWREEMSVALQTRFERTAGRLNRRLGAAA